MNIKSSDTLLIVDLYWTADNWVKHHVLTTNDLVCHPGLLESFRLVKTGKLTVFPMVGLVKRGNFNMTREF